MSRAFAVVIFVVTARGLAGEPTRARMPEPLVGESITDIDTNEPGELEVDIGGAWVARADGIRRWASTVELEARPNRRLGIAAEVSVDGTDDTRAATTAAGNLRLGASWALLDSWRHDFHLQIVGEARVYSSDDRGAAEIVLEPEVSSLPYAVGLHGAVRWGRINLRATLVGIAGGPLTVPLAANVAILVEGRIRTSPYFVGVELNADGGRITPFAVIPEGAITPVLWTLPVRIGLAAPIFSSDRRRTIAAGALLRLTVELDRD